MTTHLALRDYQEQALAAEAQHRAEHPDETRLAIVMATGLGKSIVMAERARRHVRAELDRALILVHTDELAQQAEAKVRLVASQCPRCHGSGWDPEDKQEVCWACRDRQLTVGVVKAERDETDADIIIGSVQTLANPARRQRIADVGLVIVDECHHAVSDSYQAIMRHYGCLPDCEHRAMGRDVDSLGGHCTDCYDTGFTGPPTPALGLTATLERGDGASLGGVWQNVVFTRDISWAVRRGHLVQPVGHRIEIEPPNWDHAGEMGHLENDARILDQQLVEGLAPEKVVEAWIEKALYPLMCAECVDATANVMSDSGPAVPDYCPNEGCIVASSDPWPSTVLFAPLVRSAEAFARAFGNAGISAGVIHGAMPAAERRATLAAYEAGKISVLCNAMVLTEGWDSPRTQCVIVARPTKSRALFVQMAGRGLRPDPLKPVEEQSCLILVVADATTDMCTVADLSDRPIDRRAQGALTVMEDQWDIGKALDEAEREKLWTGRVSAVEFDPLARRSSKVWQVTEHGTPFLPISKDGEYVFIVGTSVYLREVIAHQLDTTKRKARITRLHKDLPDLELALSVAEDEATDRGGDIGKLLADRSRPWRKQVPSTDMQKYARHLGLGKELDAIMGARTGGKAGRLSDLINKKVATRALEPMVAKIKERTS